MNGGLYGFDLDSLVGFGSPSRQQHQQQQQQQRQSSQQQQQQQHAQQSQYGLGPLAFDSYDPSSTRASNMHSTNASAAGLHPPPTLGSVRAPAPYTTLLPQTQLFPASLEPIPLSDHFQHQQQQQPHAPHRSSSTPTLSVYASTTLHQQQQQQQPLRTQKTASARSKPVARKSSKRKKEEPWLAAISLSVSGVSLEPLSGAQVLERIQEKTLHVQTRYLPCVAFLVECQQNLRAGLQAQRGRKSIAQSRQFYTRFLAPLPDRFYRTNAKRMDSATLQKATQELQDLLQQAKRVENQGSEAIKNSFLGGMKDGESWGLRRWLAKNGGALHICNDLESILNACQKLDRSEGTTRQLSAKLRPLAETSLKKLRKDVPDSYQQVSTAHPYLPFFHRLESALKGMANFDPDDDDVICIDDEDEIAAEKAKPKPIKRAASSPVLQRKKSRSEYSSQQSFGDIEVLEVKPAATTVARQPQQQQQQQQGWRCSRCTMLNGGNSHRCCMCGLTLEQGSAQVANNNNNNLGFHLNPDPLIGDQPDEEELQFSRALDEIAGFDDVAAAVTAADIWDPPVLDPATTETNMTASDMVSRLEHLTYVFESHQQRRECPAEFCGNECFWDIHYANALRLFVSLIRQCEAGTFLEPLADLQGRQPYREVICHPLGFGDIVRALTPNDDRKGTCASGWLLPGVGLPQWNMWRGKELIQAVDLVFLNALAYYGKAKTQERSETNKLRRMLWKGIGDLVQTLDNAEERKQVMPVRRGETSGFVMKKDIIAATWGDL